MGSAERHGRLLSLLTVLRHVVRCRWRLRISEAGILTGVPCRQRVHLEAELRTPELFQPTSPSGSLLLCWLPDWSAMPTPSPPQSRQIAMQARTPEQPSRPSCENLALRPFRLAWCLPLRRAVQAIPGSKPRPEAIRRQAHEHRQPARIHGRGPFG